MDVCLTITGPVVLLTPETLTEGFADGTFTIDAITDCSQPDASPDAGVGPSTHPSRVRPQPPKADPWRARVRMPGIASDPVQGNPSLYRVVLENDRVRVLEYRDRPGDRTTPHEHSDSVMITLSAFDRRLHQGDRTMDVSLEAGEARWNPAQWHAGENIGTTETHVLFVELKEPAASAPMADTLGPSER